MDDPLSLGGYGDGIRRRGAETECDRDKLTVNLTYEFHRFTIRTWAKASSAKGMDSIFQRVLGSKSTSLLRCQCQSCADSWAPRLFLKPCTLAVLTSLGLGLADIGT